jgi:RND superfamily putative drug exporter
MFSVIALVAWFGIGGALGPVAGKLADVQKNQNSDFLPPSAESAEAQKILDTFNTGDAMEMPLTVVFEKTTGRITAAEQDGIDAAVRVALDKPLLGSIVKRVDIGNGVKVPAVFPATHEQQALATSKDGQAYVVNVMLDFSSILGKGGEGFKQIKVLADEAKSALESPVPGVQGYVTGAVGIFAELAGAFGNIDTVLLGVTVLVVALILIVVYRSPFLWLFPLLSAGLALTTAQGAIYWLAKHDILTLNGQSQGILTVLVFGAATDYALLLIARYREELRHEVDSYRAMANALRAVWEPIAASAGTVAVGLMCLQLSELKSNAGLGPVGAAGVASALIVTLSFLPAALVLAGRRVFWPFVPHFGTEVVETKGIWGKVSRGVGQRSRRTWIITGLGLLLLASAATTLKAEGLSDVDVFTDKNAPALKGVSVLAEHDLVNPSADATVVINAAAIQSTMAVLAEDPAVARAMLRTTSPTVADPQVVNGKAAIDIFLEPQDTSEKSQSALRALRDHLHAVAGADALVGGRAAGNLDVQDASRHDRTLIIPIVLLVIMLILMLLLRSILAPVLLIATVVLSYVATLGASALVFNHVFKFPGADASFPLFAFVFLVALGIDYNIFLMTRVREESGKLGTRAGTLKALAVTGGVITSAGVVLAATFSVLGVLPLVFLAETGFAVAFGVLLDTLIVRSLLVPALTYDIGRKVWWPSRLAKAESD